MAREIGSLYYTLGIKGSADFQKTLEQARQAVLKMPKGSTSAGVTTFDSKQLSKFGAEVDRVMRSGAATFNAEMSRSITKQSRDLEAMIAQLGPTSKKGKAIQKILDIRDASGGGIGTQKASPNEIIRALKQKERFELSLEKPTKQRQSSESILKGLLDSGTIKEGETFTEYLRAGSAELAIQEGIQNKLRDAVLATNKSVADAHIAYQQSGQSASDLLELQQKLNLAAHEEQKARNSILSTQERLRANALNDKYAFVESRGGKYSRESVLLGNAAYSEASADRRLRMQAAATAAIDKQIESKRVKLAEDPAYADQTSKMARDLKLEIDGLVRAREELAALADEMDAFIEKQGLAPRALASMPGFPVDREKAINDILNEGADLTGTTADDQRQAFNKAKRQKAIDEIVSNTKTGRYTGLQAQSTEEIKKAQELLRGNQLGTLSLTRDQEVALKNHVTQWQKLGQLSRNVLDVLGKISDEEEMMSKAMAAGDASGIEKHRKNLAGLGRELTQSVSAVNNFNNETHAASMASGRWNYQMQEIGYGVQDFVQVLAGGGGLGPALRSASNNFSQFFAAAGGPTAAIASTAVALGVLGISVAMDHLGKSTENASGKIDDLIERLRVVGELNAEYAKSQGTAFGAMTGEKVSNYSEASSLRVSLQSQRRILDANLMKEFENKGSAYDIRNMESSPLNTTTGEDWSRWWNNENGLIRSMTRDTSLPFGRPSNRMTGTWAEQGVFERLMKQMLVEGRTPGTLEIPQNLLDVLNPKSKQVYAQLTRARNVVDENGKSRAEFVYKNQDEFLKAYADAGGVLNDELKKLANQVFLTRERMAEMERVQKDAVSAYAARRSSMASDEQRMSLFSGEYGKKQRASYADVFLDAAKEYQQSQSPGMRSSAASKAAEAFIGFRTNTTGGKYEGPAAEIANSMSSMLSEDINRLASLRAVINSPEQTAQTKATAAAMAATISQQMSPQAMVGMRSVISGYSPGQRSGETLDAYSNRVKSEIADLTSAMNEFANSVGLPQQQIQELAKAIEVVGDKALQSVEKQKRAANLETSIGAMAGKFSRRSDEDLARTVSQIAAAEKDAISSAIDDYLNSGRSQADLDLMNSRVNEAKVKSERDLQEADRTYQKDMFASRSMLGGDIAKLIGGREGQKYQAELNHIERLRMIEEDKNLTADEKKAAADIEGRIFGAEMEQIDRKNVSFTDVGSQWKTIQQSLQGDYTKKLSREFHEYMELARGEGVKVRLAIGN